MDFLHDLFDKFPLHKNATWDLVFNTNAQTSVHGLVSVAAADTATYRSAAGWTYSNAAGQTCPISLSELQSGLRFSNLGTLGNTTFDVALKIGNTDMSNCRIFPSLITMNPDVEAQYISNPVRTIKYHDNFVYTGLSNIGNTSISQQITANMSRLRKLTIFAFDSSVDANYPYPGYQSPWSSQPNTNTLGFKLTNLNVQVSGTYVFPQNLNADWEYFLMNSRPEGALNAGADIALSSGLITPFDYSSGAYGSIVIPLDRKLESTDDTPKSVLLSFTNNSPVPLNLVVVLTYERQFEMDCASGSIVL
jgi:hypothetical protein